MEHQDPISGEEARQLRKANQRLERRVRQLERLVETSERITRQSRSAHESSLNRLHEKTDDLQAAKEAAEAGLISKDRFLATMSHEIRTPMNGVIGCIDLLSLSSLPPEEEGLVQTLKGSAETLMALLNDVLDFAKIQEGQTQLEARAFRLRALIESVCAPEDARSAAKGVRVVPYIDPDMPERLIGDEHRLRQVLSNVVSNAVKFTSEGSVTVAVRRADGEGRVQFEVCDTGIGMAPEVQRSVFEAFTQADESTTRRFGGTGLGLAISSALVAAMGGKLEVTSQLGRGSTFYFTVPLGAAEAEPEGIGASSPEAPLEGTPPAEHEAQTAAGLRILLVDDNPVNRAVGRKLIARLDGDATLASGGAESVRRALDEDWDLILMDCSMPDVDGFEATRQIRASVGPRAQVQIVALTALSMEGDRERCLEAGMDDYLQKPIRIPALRAALARAASTRAQPRRQAG